MLVWKIHSSGIGSNWFNHILSGTIEHLLQWMKENILTGREDLFLQNGTMWVIYIIPPSKHDPYTIQRCIYVLLFASQPSWYPHSSKWRWLGAPRKYQNSYASTLLFINDFFFRENSNTNCSQRIMCCSYPPCMEDEIMWPRFSV